MSVNYFEALRETVDSALAEDIGDGDITAQLIDPDQNDTASVISRELAVICGQPWVDEVFRQVDESLSLTWLVQEGDEVEPDTELFQVSGHTRSILTAERTALNFLQTLSGTATQTRHMAGLVAHTNVGLLDTRKTLPGLRLAQKYAVSVGGGVNHRIGLYDAFLIKENHITAAGSISAAIAAARHVSTTVRLEIEVESLDDLRLALDCQPDWIMLDNFPVDDIRTAVNATNHPIKLEASGGIENENDLVAIAETGVDYISIGALTKHCRAVDLSMRLI